MRVGGMNSQVTNFSTPIPYPKDTSSSPVFPPWYDRPWMYKEPKNTENLQNWIMDWCHYLLRWCENHNNHIISVQEIMMNPGFHHSRHPLPITSVKKIFQGLIDQGIAKWIGSDSTRLRVFWKDLEEWVEIIYRWGVNGGGTTIDIYQIEKANQKFSNLPLTDLTTILELLVHHDRAEWLDKTHKIIQLIW